MIFYQLVRILVVMVCKVMFRATVEGKNHVPTQGAFVLAPVHRSFLDFALVSLVTRRRMRYMAKEALWESRFLGWLVSSLGGYPVRRGTTDREALRTTVELIAGGEPVVIFPEGGRRSGPVVEKLFEGAAYVAGRTGVPVIPVGIGGSERAQQKGKRFPRPVKVHLVVGEPLAPPQRHGQSARVSRQEVHRVTERLQDEVQHLFDAAQTRARANERWTD